MSKRLKSVEQRWMPEIVSAKNLNTLDLIYIKLFGKNGEMGKISKGFGRINPKLRPLMTVKFSYTKTKLTYNIAKKRQQIKEDFYKSLEQELLEL